MLSKEEALIINTKLFEKIAKKVINKRQLGVLDLIDTKKKTIKDMVVHKFDKINLCRKPSILKEMEKGMKKIFFGRKGIVTKKVSKLEKELTEKEIKKQYNLENKIFIGEIPYLTIKDTSKETKINKNNDHIKRQLMRSSNYTLTAKKPLLRLNRNINNKNITTTEFHSKDSNVFHTNVSPSINYEKKKKINLGNKTFSKSNTYKKIKELDSSTTSQLRTSTRNSPIKNIKGITLNIVSNTKENNYNSNILKPFQKTSLLKDYDKKVSTNTMESDDQTLLSHRPIHPSRKRANPNFLNVITQCLNLKIDNLNISSNKVESNIISLIDSSRSNGAGAAATKSSLDKNELNNDFETIFNKRIKKKKPTIITKESIQEKFNAASSMIDPIKTKMRDLQSRINKLSDKQVESYADDIAFKYLKNMNDDVYEYKENDYSNIALTETKGVQEMKRRISQQRNTIMKLRHNILQEKVKLMKKYNIVNSKEKSKYNMSNHSQQEI